MGNQKSSIEGQTMQWLKEHKDKSTDNAMAKRTQR